MNDTDVVGDGLRLLVATEIPDPKLWLQNQLNHGEDVTPLAATAALHALLDVSAENPDDGLTNFLFDRISFLHPDYRGSWSVLSQEEINEYICVEFVEIGGVFPVGVEFNGILPVGLPRMDSGGLT